MSSSHIDPIQCSGASARRPAAATWPRQPSIVSELAALDMHFGVAVFDDELRVLRANARYADMFADDGQDMPSADRPDTFVVEAERLACRALCRNLKHNDTGQLVALRTCRQGRRAWISVQYAAQVRAGVREIVGLHTDVTRQQLQSDDDRGQVRAINLSQAVVHFDCSGMILDANALFLDALGYTHAELVGRHDRCTVSTEDADSAEYAAFWRDLAAGHYRAAEFKRIGKDGREVWLQATYNPIFDSNGRAFKVVKYATDITAEKLRQADYKGQIDAINRSQGVVELALDGTIISANRNFLDTFGYTLDELRGRQHQVLVPASLARTEDYAGFWRTLRSGAFHSGLFQRTSKAGVEVWLQATYNPVFDVNGNVCKIIKFATDVSSNVAMAQAYNEAARLAQHDVTTALPNRLKLASFMAEKLQLPSARLALLYIDLDRFKPINDMFGHATGDRVLGEVADRLRRCVNIDQLAARIGGDEFVIAAPDIGDDQIDRLCADVLKALAEPICHNSGELKITASIGVAVSPHGGTSPNDLLKNSDAALYRSKQSGRGTYSRYTEDTAQRVFAHQSITQDMLRGIANQEFFLEFQPRFETESGRAVSVEALVRWMHPEKGCISPADFIPLAERNGLIVPLGEWVLHSACKTIAALASDIGVSVNISPIQFNDNALIETVVSALRVSKLAPERLELEITESVLLDHGEHARSVLDGIKALGVRLAMDDFGAGYSSLSYLRTFPFDVIKIDRQFIADLERTQGAVAIIRAVVGLGHALGLGVVAEGVETDAQLKILRHEDCNAVQGFLLARPMPAQALQGRLSAPEL